MALRTDAALRAAFEVSRIHLLLTLTFAFAFAVPCSTGAFFLTESLARNVVGLIGTPWFS
jgi:hypothetical protein